MPLPRAYEALTWLTLENAIAEPVGFGPHRTPEAIHSVQSLRSLRGAGTSQRLPGPSA